MSKAEVIALIKRNRNPYKKAITLIADFLVITKEEAEQIYAKEIERVI